MINFGKFMEKFGGEMIEELNLLEENKVECCLNKIIVEFVIFCYVFGIIFYVLVI